MATQITIKTGEDRILAVKLKDVNGTPLVVAPNGETARVTQIIVSLKSGGTPVQKYALNEEEGYGSLEIAEGEGDKLLVKALASQTATWPTGQLYAHVRIVWVDEDFPDGRAQEVSFLLGTIAAGQTADEATS